jgi:hypothetical protein
MSVASCRITTALPRWVSATREGGIRPCRAAISAHTWRRVRARAVAIRARCSGPISSRARHSVASEATGPYSSA